MKLLAIIGFVVSLTILSVGVKGLFSFLTKAINNNKTNNTDNV